LRFEAVKSSGLAHTSYYLSDSGEATVIDPRRDAQIYLDLAKQDSAEIKYVLETHRNEDYIVGSREIEAITDARVLHGDAIPFKYGEKLSDGEKLKIGRFEIEALFTPGHTPEHTCYAAYDTKSGGQPLMAFTGDALFIGDVGRTDLPGLDRWEEMSEKLYHSLHDKILPLGDHVLLYPAHTAGSICGSRISSREMSTIGYEKQTNPQLSLDKEEFITNRLENEMLRPPYFRRMEDWNLNGPPLLPKEPEGLDAEAFEEKMEDPSTVVLDTREPDAFAGSHIPDSLNIWMGGVAYFPGWIISYDEEILLLTDELNKTDKAIKYLHRIGYDDIAGYLSSDIMQWRNKGKPMDTLGTVSAPTAKNMLEKEDALLLDVREDTEYNEGHVKDSMNIYVGLLQDEIDKLPKNKTIITTCGWGGRGGIAASILKRNGFEDVHNLLGGMKAWQSLGYPLIKS